MLETMMPLVKRIGWAALVGMVGVYVYLSLAGPRGVKALLEKRQQITITQEENAELERENNRRRERIQRLKDSREEQELEIRRRLKLKKPGTRDFYIPEAMDSNPES